MKPFLLALALAAAPALALADPLPSWNDTNAKARIISFVESVTDPDSPDYVTPAERVATFDNDGTLWAEQPVYFQLIFAVDQVAKLGAADPSILTTDALRAAAARDYKALLATGKDGLIEVLRASHADMPLDRFRADVAAWLNEARHPTTGMRYDEMVYQPMLELLRYLRDEGFATSTCAYNCSRTRDDLCSGHGESADCDATGSGMLCACDAGFATSNCSVECPGGSAASCSNHGECSEGASGNGTCTCNYGWGNDDCSKCQHDGACDGRAYCDTNDGNRCATTSP